MQFLPKTTNLQAPKVWKLPPCFPHESEKKFQSIEGKLQYEITQIKPLKIYLIRNMICNKPSQPSLNTQK